MNDHHIYILVALGDGTKLDQCYRREQHSRGANELGEVPYGSPLSPFRYGHGGITYCTAVFDNGITEFVCIHFYLSGCAP
jgi:hypothetical protein